MTAPTCAACGIPFASPSKDCRRHEAWTERAALIEEGCKVSRAEAEKMATAQMARAVIK